MQLPPRFQYASNTIVLSCSKTADTERAEKVLRKGNLAEAAVLLERDIKKASNPSCDYWHPPTCRGYGGESDAHSAKSAYSGTKRLPVDPTRSRRKVVEKRLLPYWWIRSNWVAYSRIWSRRNPSRCYGRAPKFLGQKRCVHFSKGILLHISILNLMSVALVLQYLRTDIRKWREMSTQLKEKDKATFHSLSASLVITSAIFDETRGRRNCGRFQSIRAHAELERSEFSGIGDCSSIQKLYNGYHSRWRSANEWGSDNIRLRLWFIRETTDPRGHACSLVTGKTLRRLRIFLWVGQWYKKHDRKSIATWKIVYWSLSHDHRPVLLVRLQVHRYRRTQLTTLRQVQQQHDVEVPAMYHWEASHEIWQKPKTKIKNRCSQVCPVMLTLLHLPDFLWSSPTILANLATSLPVLVRCPSRDSDSERPRKGGIKEAKYLFYPSRKTEIAKCAREPRLQGLLAGSALVELYLVLKILVTW